jgi:hypothetical protein
VTDERPGRTAPPYSIPHRDTKPYAKKAPVVFKNLRSVLEADLKSLEKWVFSPRAPSISRPWRTCSGWRPGKFLQAAPFSARDVVFFARTDRAKPKKSSLSFTSTTETTCSLMRARQ